MTRLQKALRELAEAMGDRPWVFVLDPCSPDAEDWGYAMEHSPHPGYVRLGLLRMATIHLEARILSGGRHGTPLSGRGDAPLRHDFGPAGVCRRCGLDVTLGDTDAPCEA